MRAIVVTRYGDLDVLQMQEAPEPRARPGQVLVDVEAIGVNYRDVYERRGPGYGDEPPFVAGVEGAGTIAALGEGASDL
ncbi:MAG: alcohol dehydrogenase catalytic domain-containing protein, partial [Actinomycetota bacterium]